MSAEGHTNLDNDAAGDLICVTSRALFDRILLLMRHPNGHEYDDQEIGELFFLHEVVFALHAREMLSQTESMAEILTEIDPYIERWEAYHRQEGHYPVERRASMRKSFDSLIALIQGLEPDIEWVQVEPTQEDLDLCRKIFDYSDSQGNPK